MAIIITGGPGVGKHTIADRIAKLYGLDVLDLNRIAIESGIVEKATDTLDVDVQMLRCTLSERMSTGVLVVGHLAPHVISKEQVKVAIVLRRNPYSLESIYKKRGYSEAKSIQNQGSEILGIVAYDAIRKFGRDKVVQIDTSERSIDQTVCMVSDAILKGIPGDEIDWLEYVNLRGDMKRFFPTG